MLFGSGKNPKPACGTERCYWRADPTSLETQRAGYVGGVCCLRSSQWGRQSGPSCRKGELLCQGVRPSSRPSCDQSSQFYSCSASNRTSVSQLYCHITRVCLPSALIKRGLIFQHDFGSSLAQHPHRDTAPSQHPLRTCPVSNTGDAFPQPPWDTAGGGRTRDFSLWLMSLPCTTEPRNKSQIPLCKCGLPFHFLQHFFFQVFPQASHGASLRNSNMIPI